MLVVVVRGRNCHLTLFSDDPVRDLIPSPSVPFSDKEEERRLLKKDTRNELKSGLAPPFLSTVNTRSADHARDLSSSPWGSPRALRAS